MTEYALLFLYLNYVSPVYFADKATCERAKEEVFKALDNSTYDNKALATPFANDRRAIAVRKTQIICVATGRIN